MHPRPKNPLERTILKAKNIWNARDETKKQVKNEEIYRRSDFQDFSVVNMATKKSERRTSAEITVNSYTIHESS